MSLLRLMMAGQGAAAAGDPYWENVVSLNRYNSANGSVTIADERGVIWTRSGDAVVSDTNVKYGIGSLRVPNTTGNDDFYAPSDLIIPAGSPASLFTLDTYAYVDTLVGYQSNWNVFIGQGGTVGNTDQIFGLENGKLRYYRGPNLAGGSVNITGTSTVAVNQYNLFSMTYDGTTIRIYLNNVLEGSANSGAGWINTGQPVRLGRNIVVGFESFRLALRGNLDDTRITRRVARPQSPPYAAVEFPNFGDGSPATNIVWNSSDKAAGITLSGSDLSALKTSGGEAAWSMVRATNGHSTGKRYFEILSNAGTYDFVMLGVSGSGTAVEGGLPGTDANGYGIYKLSGEKITNGVLSAYGSGFGGTHVVGVAVDFDVGKIWFSIDGTWVAGGNPAAGTGEAFSGMSGVKYPAVAQLRYSSGQQVGRFKASSFSYSPPSGFTPWGL